MKWFRKKQPALPGGGEFHYPPTDPQGSYTGVPEEELEQPVQDADDL